jgi:folate-binding protein YgfZ
MTAALFYGNHSMTSFHDTITSLLQNKDIIAQQDIGVLRVAGPDAKKFLQGQITCDINKLSPDNGLYGAICSIKGRIISSFYLAQEKDDVLMLMSKDLIDKTLLHLKKYAVFFKAELTNDNERFDIYTQITSLSLESAPEKLAEILPTSVDSKNTITMTLCQYPITVQWLITHSDTASEEQTLEEKNKELAVLAILAARPIINLEQSETFLPQWLNMQRTGGISFTKGCYTGQEIVARMQYKGKSKKQLALFKWQGVIDTTKDIVNTDGKNIGQIIASTSLQESYFAQAIINVDPNESETFLLDDKEITTLPLPYLIESANAL